MKLTPLDIHHKEFGHSIRGYHEGQVDEFLDEVADEFERLFKENIDLSERIEVANERVRSYQAIEATLNNTLLQAQRSSEEIIARAGNEADLVLRDAELKAKEIIHSALQKRQTVAAELIRIKQAEEEFRARYRSLLENQMRSVTEVCLPDDVSVLLGETDDGIVADIDVLLPAAEAPQDPAPRPKPEPKPEPVEKLAPAVKRTTAPIPVIEPPASGFVQSVALGEVSSPELALDDVDLVEPGEFELPSFDMLGERDVDEDIEEID